MNETGERSTACFKFREDYVECLHHKKEYTRENEIERERVRRNEEHAEAIKEELTREMTSISCVTHQNYAPRGEKENRFLKHRREKHSYMWAESYRIAR